MADPLSTLFLPHGGPDLAVTTTPAADFLRGLGARRATPDGVVIISAHWETRGTAITTSALLETVHDFYGFGAELSQLNYPAKTTPKLIAAVTEALAVQRIPLATDSRRGMDHGAWGPLMLMYPKADVPVVQLSLDHGASPKELFDLGRALAPLRAQNIQIIGSGAMVHNLRQLGREGSAIPRWASDFEAWADREISARNWPGLFDVAQQGVTQNAHPTLEHFYPLMVAAGAGGADDPTQSFRKIHASFSYGSISMAAWEFGVP